MITPEARIERAELEALCVARSMYGSLETWREIGPAIWGIETSIYGDEADQDIPGEMSDPRTTIVVLQTYVNNSLKIIGYTHAIAPSRLEDNLPPGENARRRHISGTALSPEYQRKGLVWGMLDTLEDSLAADGFVEYSRNAEVDNGYAGAIKRRFDIEARLTGVKRILEDHPQNPEGSWNNHNQHFFRIVLPRPHIVAPARRVTSPQQPGHVGSN